MLEFLPQKNSHIVGIKAIDCIEHEDHMALTAMLDTVTEGESTFSLYFDVTEMRNWDVVEVFDELLIILHNWGRFDKVAVIGLMAEEKLAVQIMNIFVPGEMRFFSAGQKSEAQSWIEA